MCNLYSVTKGQQAIREAREQVQATVIPNANSTEAHWQGEDDRIREMDFARWDSDAYTLRQDEYSLFVDCINNSTLARNRGVIVWWAPDKYLATVLASPGIAWDALTATVSADDHVSSA